MKLTDYLDQELIYMDFNADNKSALLRKIADRVSERFPEVNRKELYEKLNRREQAGSTGIGRGVAIPHATVDGLPKTVCMLICISKGISFDAVDQLPVRLVFFLVSPPGETGLHIKLLARIARLVKKAEFLDTVATSCNSEEIYRQVAKEDNRHVE
ncbi:MAG: PTS sugar transporter subunit IIA [Desulfobacterales bacterium]|nr:PTS sugar transporter subunit IIA [Desulfobacterales bacterium]